MADGHADHGILADLFQTGLPAVKPLNLIRNIFKLNSELEQ